MALYEEYPIAVEDGRFTEYAASLLRQRHRSHWITGSREQLLYDCDHATFERVAEKVHSTFPVCEIDRICQVNAPQMYGMYLLRKEEMQSQRMWRPNAAAVQEMELFHVTTESKGNESLKNGLDWRRTRRSRFGCGVSFSDDADYADYYANNQASDERRVIIVCAVLVADKWTVRNVNKRNRGRGAAGDRLAVPPGASDTTVSPNGRVYVKYYDHEFYPLYMVYYRRGPDVAAASRYNNGIGGGTANARRLQLQQQHQQQQQQQQRLARAAAEETRRRREQEERERLSAREREKRRQELERARLRLVERQRRENLVWANQRVQQQQQQQRRRASQQDSRCLIL